jgi:hypothetical protein
MEIYQCTAGLCLGRHKNQGKPEFCGYTLHKTLRETWTNEQKAMLCGESDLDYLVGELKEMYIKERLYFALWGDIVNAPLPANGPFDLKVECLIWHEQVWQRKSVWIGDIFGKDMIIPLKANKVTIEELFITPHSLQYHC